ncbi:MAG: DNA polymerase III subunit gamma/tau [Gammaproteobacteria bacterium]
MTYQVLARKWRPKSFDMLVGQPFAKQALSNALKRGQLHHAYLFGGTRGVGKTTIARILAKCLNCETGVTVTPCGQCQTCEAIDAGRYVDLIEVDAASRTRVEDTRELLENVQYLPVQGRFKVYLIDEVHMLSGHSFNALLKTLEEPPAHVKFLLATTEPERLPVTVLSRCLRFDLQPINEAAMQAHLAFVLKEERHEFEDNALLEIAKAAKGSVRDALSLLEQALAFCENIITLADVQTLLGLGHQNLVGPILGALIQHEPIRAFEQVECMESKGVAFEAAIDTLLEGLHDLALAKALPEIGRKPDYLEENEWQAWLSNIAPEEIQLLYQIGLKGKQDFVFAPSQRKGFEMMLLRMLCFKPKLKEAISMPSTPSVISTPKSKPIAAPSEIPQGVAPRPQQPLQPVVTPAAASVNPKQLDLKKAWSEMVPKLPLVGLSQVIAQSCVVSAWQDPMLSLLLEHSKMACLNDARRETIEKALSQYLGKPIKLSISIGEVGEDTPANIMAVKKQQKQERVEAAVRADHNVKAIIETFDATIEKIIPND